MCVLIVKERGIKMPSKEILKACAKANPNGCGFVSEKDSFKSMNFEEFYKRLKNVSTDENCIIHFRWATTGSVKATNCHPFEHKGYFFAHNGVLHIETENDMTDSETAFRKVFYPAIAKFGFDSETFADVVNYGRGTNKFAFMHRGEIRTFGQFNTIDGVMYSNMNWSHCYNQKREYIPFAYGF